MYGYHRTFWVYILKCSDGSYYVGVTNGIKRRFAEHQNGRNPGSYTHSRRPVELVFSREFTSILKAIAFEKQLKKWSRAKKEALIARDFGELHRLAACRNETNSENWSVSRFGSAQRD
ncbi:MAG: GIY-YIG nuclease family protein [Bacteroidetes bacterium]|nr:GIY-YIG nuclease family protein [Bacteroidota bacterium]